MERTQKIEKIEIPTRRNAQGSLEKILPYGRNFKLRFRQVR